MTHAPFSLHGQNALITGASGGIGSSIASALYGAGAHVTLSGTKIDNLKKLESELQNFKFEGERPKIFIRTCNLSEEGAMENLIKETTEEMGSLDILVNNAGITRDGLLMRMKDEDWAQVLDINLSSCFKACRAAIKGMMSKRHGRIINIASVVGVTGNPGQTNYCASKAGMIGFSKALASEVATRGITVNCIAPGFIASNMTEVLPDTVKEKILGGIPMNRMGNPEEIAHGVLFLASPSASYITGQTLHINGGMAMI